MNFRNSISFFKEAKRRSSISTKLKCLKKRESSFSQHSDLETSGFRKSTNESDIENLQNDQKLEVF